MILRRIKIALVFTLLGGFLISAAAQDKGMSDVDKVVLKLKQKVLLTEDQSQKVKVIIVNYLKDNDYKAAKEKLTKILDKKQNTKFSIIVDSWWKGINKLKKSEVK